MKKASLFLFVAVIIGICIPSCSINKPNTKPNPQLEALKKENKTLKQQLDKATADLNALSTEMENKIKTGKYPLEIDDMLNVDDTTIFTERFKDYELNAVHPRSREMYQWVSNIHELGLLLQQIEKDHLSVEKINADLTNLPPTTIKQLESLNMNIKNNIQRADEKREIIEQSYNEMKKTFSLAQMNYYNNLVGKLNNFINIYFE